MRPNILLPNHNGVGENETINGENNIVIIGANGAGKSRLGSRIEFNQPQGVTVHRISAQRALNLPDSASMKTLEIAEKWLFFGFDNPQASSAHKEGHRWGNSIETHLLSDYDQLLSTLFARSVKRDSDHSKETREKQTYIPVPNAPIETIVEVWQDIMPQNSISFNDGKVIVRKDGQQPYHGKGMSDGERVALYLIGQCLVAPDNSIIIIDEPEIHLHKSLMVRLWNKIEELCPDKVLVYITHDLDFASSRKGAIKLWIKDFKGGTSWVWEEVPEIENIPENLTIEIVGNRKNVLFCEGDKGSYDYVLYQAVYPTYHVIPRGSCEKVIESTKAVNENPSIAHIQTVGIIDSDYRASEEVNALKGHQIFTINVSEVENLLCIEPLLKLVAVNQHIDPNALVSAVTSFISEELKKEFDLQVTNHAEREIQFRLNTYIKTSDDENGLHDGLKDLLSKIDVNAIYTKSRELFQNAIDKSDLSEILRIYNRKKLAERISPIFGLGKGEYVKIIFRMLKGPNKSKIVEAVKGFMPHL